MDTYRLFLAVDLRRDTDARLDALTAAAHREVGREFRPVSKGRRHLTLRFLGDTDSNLVESMASDIGKILGEEDPFYITVEGAGAFPNPERARVLWAGIEEGSGRVADLAASINEILSEDYGFDPESKPFHPHVTVGRFRGRPMDVRELIDFYAGEMWGRDPVEEVQLIRSQLGRGGPTYTVLEKIPLGGDWPTEKKLV
ncbi:MAG: RNA 2',3'-cyclic phosphodiesterase [Bacillota bacterium]